MSRAVIVVISLSRTIKIFCVYFLKTKVILRPEFCVKL